MIFYVGVDDDILSLDISGEDLPDLIDLARLIVDDTKLLEGVKKTILNIQGKEEKPQIEAGQIIRWWVTRSEEIQHITPGFIVSKIIAEITQQIG